MKSIDKRCGGCYNRRIREVFYERGDKEELSFMYRFFFKRFLDILLSLFGIVILALPMLIIALAIKMDSKGPVIFKQERYGKNGKVFQFYKFRSMTKDAPHDMPTREIQGESYITKVGGFLRKTSLDELPQMFCILKGDMSIIGPRPVVLTETELHTYRQETGAVAVRPGLTGLAQVTARDNLKDMRLKAEIDGEYVKKISFWRDMKIFFKTIVKVLKRDDIVEGTGTEATAQAAELLNKEQPSKAQEGLENVALADDSAENAG